MACLRMTWVSTVARWRQSVFSSALIGVVVGIAFSLALFPLVDEGCLRQTDGHHTGGRSLQSDLDMQRAVPDWADADEYEPRLQLDGPKSVGSQQVLSIKEQQSSKPVVRPRFFSSELSIKEKLFVAIISTGQTVSTLGVSLNETLHSHVDTQMIFVPASKAINSRQSVVEIATKFPAAKFPLEVVRYIGDHHVKEYDFFFLVEDLAYVRGMKLLDIVNHISISQSVYMGESVDGSLFCSLRSGVLLSNSVLTATRDNVHNCIRDQETSPSASDNLGRCVTRSAAISCQQNVQGQRFKTFVLPHGPNFDSDLKSLRKQREFNTALIIHPIEKPEEHYKLHLYFSRYELGATALEIEELEKEIAKADAHLDESEKVTAWPVGTDPPFKSTEHFSVIRWDYLTDNYVYPDGELDAVRNLTMEEVADVAEVVNASVNLFVQESGHDFSYERVVNFYRRFDPTRGMEYVVDLMFHDKLGDTTVRRTEAIRPLGKVELIPMPYVTENTRLVMVLPVTIRDQVGALQFLKEFTDVCLEKQDNSILLLVLFYEHTNPNGIPEESVDAHSSVKESVNTLNSKYHSEGAKISWLSIKMTNGILPADLGMLDLVSKKFPGNTLFLVCQSGMELRVDYLNRVRMNTIEGWQVFFPIPFAQYHPDIVFRGEPPPSTIEIHKKHGHFSSHSFVHYSFYNSDYQVGRKATESSVPRARNDRDLNDKRYHAVTGHDVYSMFLAMKSVHVMRAVDPSLRIHFQTNECLPEMSTDTRDQCLFSRSEGLASRPELASLLFDYEKEQITMVNHG